MLGAKEQLANLIGKVVNATNLPAAVKTQLIASLQSLVAGFDPNKPLQRAVACLTLRAFIALVPYRGPARAGHRMDRRREPHQGGARLLNAIATSRRRLRGPPA